MNRYRYEFESDCFEPGKCDYCPLSICSRDFDIYGYATDTYVCPFNDEECPLELICNNDERS